MRSPPHASRRGQLSPDPGIQTPPETSCWVEVAGVPMYGRWWRSADVPADPSVVLIHGLAAASPMCVPAARQLARHFHVYAPDLPGFGRSGKPDGLLGVSQLAAAVGRWMDAVGVRGAVAVGTSIGSQIAADLARQRTDLVAAVVLASPTVDRGRRRWRQQIPRWLVEQQTHSHRMRTIMVAGWTRAGIRRSLATFQRCMRDPLEHKLAQVRQPCLVLYGTRDPLISKEWVTDVAERLPDARLRVLPGVVHNMAHDNPVELTRTTTHFLSPFTGRC